MIGLPPRICALCGEWADLGSLFTDYAGRVRYLCSTHCKFSLEEVNRILLTSSTTELRRE